MRKLLLPLLLLVSTCLSFSQTDSTNYKFIELSFVGDVMGHDPQIAGAWMDSSKSYEYDHVFQYIKPIIENTDYGVANLELTLAGSNYKGYPQFCSPDSIASALNRAGFDMLLTSNNHSVDRGDFGIKRTLEVLDKKKIPHTGTFLNKAQRDSVYPLIQEVNGCTIAFLNCTYGTNELYAKKHLVNYIDTAEIRKDLEKARKKADFVIMCVHWGLEYKLNASTKQRRLAKFFFEKGADLVIGGHPHVLQEIEKIPYTRDGVKKEGLIYFSHGNFVSNQRARTKDGGMISKVTLKLDSAGTVSVDDFGYIPTWVWRKKEGDKYRYFIVPVNLYESNPKMFPFTENDKLKIKTFITDTRGHLKGIKEYKKADW